MKKLFQLFSLIFLVSCAGHAPQMERKVKVWNGSHEEAGICRMSTEALKASVEEHLNRKIKIPVSIIKKIHQGTISRECISASDVAIDQYACMTFSDLGVLYDYIEKLSYSCKKW